MTDCNCDQAKALQSELADLRAAAHLVLAWIDRSNSVGREAAQRLERALAVGGEVEVSAVDEQLLADLETVRLAALEYEFENGGREPTEALNRIEKLLRP